MGSSGSVRWDESGGNNHHELKDSLLEAGAEIVVDEMRELDEDRLQTLPIGSQSCNFTRS